ncbi:hypothetical protein [Actinophytocola sp. NPDC049390]|uniref:hypothetical protein n=1 Tax=Actinophytocola sp. NPDC049390 TaxID=3363894 RepID=UPI0037B15BDF
MSIEARWCRAEQATSALLDIAYADIVRRAEEVSNRRILTESARLQGELNKELYEWKEVPGTPVIARGYDVTVETDPELVTAVEARTKAMRRQLVRSWVDEQRVQRTDRMSTLVLDPLRATAAWYLDNQDKPEQVVTIAKKFQELRETLAPETLADTVGRLLDELVAPLDPVRRWGVIDVVGKLFRENDRADLVARLDAWGADGGEPKP